MSGPQARLSILTGKRGGETVELAPGSYQVGTGRDADVQLRDAGVSFKHAQIVVEDGGAYLVDLKSKGGTFVNGSRLEPNQRHALGPDDSFTVGTVDMRLAVAALAAVGAAPAPAPAAAARDEEALPLVDEAPSPLGDDEDPGVAAALAEPAAEPEAAPAVEEEPAAEPEAPAPAAALPDDTALLKQRCRELERALAEKTQEAKAYEEALEARGPAGGAEGGYTSDTVSYDLEARILELQHQSDDLTARLAEKDAEIAELEKKHSLELSRAERKLEERKKGEASAHDDLQREYGRLEEYKERVKTAEAEVAKYEELNSELVLEAEELKERVEALKYQVEQEQGKRGELVRERIVELRAEVERLEKSNAEMRTLVEAYEEKIDELDERVEEVEGENEAHEKLVNDLRNELSKVKTERDTMVKTLRKKLAAAEQKLERGGKGGGRDPGGAEAEAEEAAAEAS